MFVLQYSELEKVSSCDPTEWFTRILILTWKLSSSKCSDPFALKAFDLCQTAASRISTAGKFRLLNHAFSSSPHVDPFSTVTSYREKYGLLRASPFLTPALLSAGCVSKFGQMNVSDG
jgi:hypothetical protein